MAKIVDYSLRLTMLSDLFEFHLETLKSLSGDFRRYLYSQINYKDRLIGIVGARGVGKTTLLLQHYQETFASPEVCLYMSADNIVVNGLGLFEIGREFFRLGGQVLMIDEIHKYKNWSSELKNLYDTFPKAKFLISGSSTLDILKGKSDLSRRLVLHTLRGMSLREYINLETGSTFAPIPLATIFDQHVRQASKVVSATTILKHFKAYLQRGYYPFYHEGKSAYQSKLENILEKIVYEDIPSVFDIKPSSIPILKKIIYLVATSEPFTPNIEKISSQLKISKEYAYHYLDYLERAKIFIFLHQATQGFKLVRKPEKIYLENPNLIQAIVGKHGFRSEIGAVRESFFINQVAGVAPIFSAEQGDFFVDNKFTIEVGGRKKTTRQIHSLENAYLAVDDIEVGAGNKIPLWLFGFLY